MNIDVRWSTWDGIGLEHLTLRQDLHRIIADSVVICDVNEKSYGMRYRVECDEFWRVRYAKVEMTGSTYALELNSDGEGNWIDGKGFTLQNLSGCIDIDIGCTPFTNSLPIRRLNMAEKQMRDVRVAYVSIPDLKVDAMQQRYSCITLGERYKYERFMPDYSVDLVVDVDGLIVEYPQRFQRLS